MYGTKKNVRAGATRHGATRLGLVTLASLFTLACSVFGVRSEKQPGYEVVRQEGNNSGQQAISMTAPVLQEKAQTGATIAMTAPVLQAPDRQGWTMSFIMPASSTMDTLPRPLDDTITLHEVAPTQVAVLRYSWGTSGEKITRLGHELLAWIETQAVYEVMSQPRSARYDPPFTLPFLRRNEIHVDVRHQPD